MTRVFRRGTQIIVQDASVPVGLILEAKATADAAVSTLPRPLTDDLKEQARDNIGAVGFYETRAEFAARVASGYAPADGTVVSAGGLQYVRSAGATALPGLAGWLPFGDVYPDHFAENVTPGTTDMAPALQAVFDFGAVAHLRPVSYRLNSAVTSTKNGTGIIGQGDNSRITRGFASGDLVTFGNPDGIMLGVTLERFSMDSAISSVTAGAMLALDGVRNSNLNGVNIYRGLIGFHFRGVTQTNVDNCMVLYQTNNGEVITGRRYVLIEETDNAVFVSSGFSRHCGDLFFSNFNGRSGATPFCERGVQIHSCDGVWFSNSHIGNCTGSNVRILSDREIKNIGILFDNCWLDIGSGSGVIIAGATPIQMGDYRFRNCKLLGGAGQRGFAISGRPLRVVISDCEISGYQLEAIALEASFEGDLLVSDCLIHNVSRASSGAANAIVHNGTGRLHVRDSVIEQGVDTSQLYSRAISFLNPTTRQNVIVENVKMEPGIDGIMTLLSSGVDIVQRDNKGFNPVGRLFAGSAGASPWTYTNPYGFPVDVYIGGGSVSQFAKNGQALPPGVREVINLGIGESLTLTHSSAPTVHVYGY